MPAEVAAIAAQAAHSPAFRVRIALPAAALAELGVHVTPLPLFTAEQSRTFATGTAGQRLGAALAARRTLGRVVRDLNGTDTTLIQRQADILPTLTLERRAARGRRLVLDVDDAIWHDGRGSGGHPLAFLKGSGRKTAWLAGHADTVVAGNHLLAEHLARHNDDVRVIPSLIDLDAAPLRAHAETDTLVAAWIGSGTTVQFLEALRPALERAAAAIAPLRLELLVVGGHLDPVAGTTTTVVDWSEASERAALERMDIGLMPLDDTPFTRGKCAYKALQYMGSGVPVVADDVGVSAQVIGDRHGGLISRSPDEWVDAIAALAADVELRRTLGAEGRQRVADGFSYARWLPELADVLRGT
jgi:glycosyltransferase involved in cell wall biosynthesis